MHSLKTAVNELGDLLATPTPIRASEEPQLDVRDAGTSNAKRTATGEFDFLFRIPEIQDWHRKVTSTYNDPVFIMAVIPTVHEMGEVLSSFSFVSTSNNQLVIKAGTIAPIFSRRLANDRWVLCLCGGFSKEQGKEVLDALASRNYTAYVMGKDMTQKRFVVC